ncbi:hypothetical protein [Candidatus Endomicrobiellum devescovinae]|jgi:hypothetical protein|uniref:hypothetical protein n=1 Tax=Candidatus Endomicrobiellum devescovinae TaxID=3242322 RepID=UPI0028384ADD|nr:hypothetical protein [Endomicrobium sp.]
MFYLELFNSKKLELFPNQIMAYVINPDNSFVFYIYLSNRAESVPILIKNAYRDISFRRYFHRKMPATTHFKERKVNLAEERW